MVTQSQQPLVQITDRDFQAGFEEAHLPCFADCAFRTDMGLVEVVQAMLTEFAVERGLFRTAVTTKYRLYHRYSESRISVIQLGTCELCPGAIVQGGEHAK